jgi:RNA polymerase sigma factor (sigma-70 family)
MTTDPRPNVAPALVPPLDVEATGELLARVRRGDEGALDQLLTRCLPALQRWARGRLPMFARSAMDTSDLVQETVLAVVRHLETFEPRHQGALQAYLRQAVINRIRDVIRYRQRRPNETSVPSELAAEETSPLDRLIGLENVGRYEAALQRLRPQDREAIVGRFELQYDFEELAILLNKPTVNATRVAVTRAMRRLIDELRHAG